MEDRILRMLLEDWEDAETEASCVVSVVGGMSVVNVVNVVGAKDVA